MDKKSILKENEISAKQIINLLKNNKKKNYSLHLLLHPIWWTTPENLCPAEKIAFHLENKYEGLKKAASSNCRPYLNYIKNKR